LDTGAQVFACLRFHTRTNLRQMYPKKRIYPLFQPYAGGQAGLTLGASLLDIVAVSSGLQVVWLYSQCKVQIIQRVFMTGINQCVLRESRQTLQRVIKVLSGAPQQSAAASGKECIAREDQPRA